MTKTSSHSTTACRRIPVHYFTETAAKPQQGFLNRAKSGRKMARMVKKHQLLSLFIYLLSMI
jgi:hypothetical protein